MTFPSISYSVILTRRQGIRVVHSKIPSDKSEYLKPSDTAASRTVLCIAWGRCRSVRIMFHSTPKDESFLIFVRFL